VRTFDIPTVLTALGIDYSERGAEANSLCPMHKERTGKDDHSPSWWINLESGMHTCFSCGYKGNIVQLVCDIKEFYVEVWDVRTEYDYKAAEVWIASVAEVPIEVLVEMVKKLPTYILPSPKPVAMSEARLAVFVEPPMEAMESRSISVDSSIRYGILWDSNTKTWILPLRDPETNTLLGWQEKGTIDRTFKNRPVGLQKSRTLFGIATQSPDIAVVVESPLDCARMDSAGITGAVAICGASVSEEQVKLIRASSKVVVALDNPNFDTAGRKGCEEFRKYARQYGINLFFFNYGDSEKKDPGEMTNEEIRWGVENAKPSILGEQAYVSRNTETVSG
jgi:hypothetical protein